MQDTPRNSRRVVAFIVVLAVHGVLIWGFNAGLTDIIREKVLGDIKTVDIAPPKPDEDRPPPPPPKIDTTPPPFVPPPDIDISIPVEDNSSAIVATTTERPTVVPVAAPPAPKIAETSIKMDPRRQFNLDDYYPAASRRAGEEGTVVLRVHVLETGKIDAAEVVTSSGFPRLDEAAVSAIKTTRMIPATREGKPIAGSVTIPMKFKLKKD